MNQCVKPEKHSNDYKVGQAQRRVVKYRNWMRYRKGAGRGEEHDPCVFAERIAVLWMGRSSTESYDGQTLLCLLGRSEPHGVMSSKARTMGVKTLSTSPLIVSIVTPIRHLLVQQILVLQSWVVGKTPSACPTNPLQVAYWTIHDWHPVAS